MQEPFVVVRTFELFDIEWFENGKRVSRWTGFDTKAEAVGTVARATREGQVIRRVWDAAMTARTVAIAAGRPIAERPFVAGEVVDHTTREELIA